MLNSINPMLL